MTQTPEQPDSGPSWRGRSVATRTEPEFPYPPRPAPPGVGDRPPPVSRGQGGGGSGPKWGVILSVIFALLAIGILVWGLGISEELAKEEDARIAAEREAAAATTQRNEAIETANAAVGQAKQEIELRATAQAERQQAIKEANAAEERAEQEAYLRATAEAETRRAESARNRAESEAQRQADLREDALSNLENIQVRSAKELALELARTNTTIKAIATGEVNFYIEPLPWYAAEGVHDAVDDIVDSLESYRPQGARLSRTTERRDADIGVRWVRDYGDHVLGLAIHQTVLHVGLGSTNCNDEWQAFDPATVKKILWHEFGHAFGYGHSNDPDNVMYPTTRTRFAVEQDISKVIAAGWTWRFPLCESGKYSLRFAIDDEDETGGFDLVVLRKYVDWDDYHDEDYDAYPFCGKGQWRRIWRSCEVEPGAYIYIKNYNSLQAIRLTGEIILLDEPDWPNMQWDENAFYYDQETLDYYRKLFAED